MEKTFHLTVAHLAENLFEGEALSVTLPGAEGVFTVLKGHEAFVTPLREGTAVIKDAEGTIREIPLEAGGIAEVSGSQTTVLL